ncbi:MAG: hypothetical protein F2799_05855 [Actinobacteria bacterium]|uniref:Unannotated protein n=1 Tax=freshwater metagenome TaxID=449393 RepID=A0A6J7E5M1_9ZZZZ|nr:hypothetical protein [Actinomycetota bacterium]
MLISTSVLARTVHLRRSLQGAAALACMVTMTGGMTTAAQAAVQPPQITAGVAHSCVVISGGTIKCWGYNGWGTLGNGTTTDSSLPVSVSGITTATQVAAGDYYSCALLTGGTVKCWGENTVGQLGDRTTTDSHVPVGVTGITTSTQITAGNRHSCALLSGGTVKCWGSNNGGQLGDGTTADSNVPVGVTGITTPTRMTVAKSRHKITKTFITFTTSVTVSGAGKLSQVITHRTGRKTRTLCTAKATTTTAHGYTLTCKITKAGRAVLRKTAMTLTLTTTFTPTGGTKVTKKQVVKLRRTR